MTAPKRKPKSKGTSPAKVPSHRAVDKGRQFTTAPALPAAAPLLAEPEQGQGSKQQRQIFSCAECKRLKLKCSRTWPCTSCEKRGCAQVCPNGTIRMGKGKKPMLAETEELHHRIASLELALAQSQARHSTQPHPLLAETYLYSPRDIARDRPAGQDRPVQESQDELAARAAGDTGPGQGAEEEDVVGSAFGTLTIGKSGEARFIGSFAGSEYLQADTDRAAETGAGLLTPPATAALTHDRKPDVRPRPAPSGHPAPGFMMGGYAEAVDIDELRAELPDWEREGRELVANYWENVAWMHQIVPQPVFEKHFLQPAYESKDDIHPHKLAVVFLIMALGVMFDLKRPAFDDRGAEFLALGQACLSAAGFEQATPSTVRALHLYGTYVLNDKHGSGSEIFWPVLGVAVKVAYSLGLHRDASLFELSTEEAEERRQVWWELVTYDRLQAMCFARPAGLSGRTTDTKLPTPDGGTDDAYHHTKYRIAELMEKVIDVETQIAPVPFSLVKTLDNELVDFKKTMPDSLLPLPGIPQLPFDATVSPQLVYRRLAIRLQLASCRLLLSRPFFARALKENPTDPSFCKHGESFVALFEAAREIVQVVERMVVYHPSLVARWWQYWFHAFSAACCCAAIVIRAPLSAFAAPAYDGLIAVLDLATATPQGCRAKKGIPILLRLRARAQDSMRQTGRHGAINHSFRSNLPGQLAPYFPSQAALQGRAAQNDDLAHLEGTNEVQQPAGGSGGSTETRAGQHAGQLVNAEHRFHPNPPGPYMGAGRPRADTAGSIFPDYTSMVSPASANSAATSMTLADRPWEGVVPPPPPPQPMQFAPGGHFAGMADTWAVNLYNYEQPLAISAADAFPTLLSGSAFNYLHPQDQTYLWSPPGTSSSLSSAPYPGGSQNAEAGPSGYHWQSPEHAGAHGGAYDEGGETVGEVDGQIHDIAASAFQLGIDLDMSMAMGFGGGSGDGGWDWESLINGNADAV